MLDDELKKKAHEYVMEHYSSEGYGVNNGSREGAAFIAGAEWQKEQMLKDAVESEAEELYNDGESQCTVSVGTYFKPGDKVYVLKAEEK